MATTKERPTAYTTTAREWFDGAAQALVRAAPAELARDIAGPVLFDIGGADGGRWLVDFGARTVSARADDVPVRVIVRAGARDFMALVEGRMSADDGIVTKRLHVAGDLAAIAHLMDGLVALARS